VVNAYAVTFGGLLLFGKTYEDGTQPIQTFVWASCVTPGFLNPKTARALQDTNPHKPPEAARTAGTPLWPTSTHPVFHAARRPASP
jgi:hypothetical protein